MARTLRIFGLIFLYLLGAAGTVVSLWSGELVARGVMAMDDVTSVKLLIASIALVFFTMHLAREKVNV